jgi:hypothetical protein
MRDFGPGDEMPPKPGNGSGITRDAIYDFCNANGGASGGNGANNPVLCTGSPAVKLIMYAEDTNSGGANQRYIVKSVGVFKVRGFEPPNQNNGQRPCSGAAQAVSASDASICGFFSTTATNGAFTGSNGLTFKPAIVL